MTHPTRMLPLMNKRSLALLAGLALAVPACKDSTSVGDLNNVSADALSAGLTKSSAGLLAIGLANASRTELDSRYIVFSETMARDFYRLDNAENRYITELIGPSPADYSAFTGGGAEVGDGGLRPHLQGAVVLSRPGDPRLARHRDRRQPPDRRAGGGVRLQAERAGRDLRAAGQRGDRSRRGGEWQLPLRSAQRLQAARRLHHAGGVPEGQPGPQGQGRAVPRTEPPEVDGSGGPHGRSDRAQCLVPQPDGADEHRH